MAKKPKIDIDRTSMGLSDALFDELEKLMRGEVTPQHAQAFATVAGRIADLSKLEMNYARYVSDSRTDDGTRLKSLPMGSDYDHVNR